MNNNNKYFLLSIFLLVYFLSTIHHADAALSPSSQQHKEKNAISESDELRGRFIRSMTMYEENEIRYYHVESEQCTYQFIIDYHLNFFDLFGLVGPQKFSVKIDGEPDCKNSEGAKRHKNDNQIIILESISKIYDVPMDMIEPDMSLYHTPKNKKNLGMDFRIIALRARIEKIISCHIKTDLFMTIRTVVDLLTIINEHCTSSKETIE